MTNTRCVRRIVETPLPDTEIEHKQIQYDDGIGDWSTYIKAKLPNGHGLSGNFLPGGSFLARVDQDLFFDGIRDCNECKHKLVCLVQPEAEVTYEKI